MHTYRTHFRAGGHGTVGGCVDDPGYLGAGGLGVGLLCGGPIQGTLNTTDTGTDTVRRV